MTQQTEAQRLADALDALLGYRGINADVGKAAAELRRLDEVEKAYSLLLEKTYAQHRREEMTRPPTAQLDWSLYVTCPKCDESNDLSDPQHDTEHDISNHIFSNRWERLKDWEVTCEHCNHEFKIEKVEY